MPSERAKFEVEISTKADLTGAKAALASLQGQRDALQAMGKDAAAVDTEIQKLHKRIIDAEIGDITGGKKGTKGAEELIDGHHSIHAIGHAINEAIPGFQEFTHFLTSGFTGAIGAVVLAFGFLKENIDGFVKRLADMDSGPGASGEWATKIADNVKAAAVEEALFNQRLQETLTAQENLATATDEWIARGKKRAGDDQEVSDAQKEFELARLGLAEKLGQVTSEQAVKVRIEIDEAAFKRELDAKKAEIQFELNARIEEASTSSHLTPQLQDAKVRADTAALKAKNDQEKNGDKLAQDKTDLEALKQIQQKMDSHMFSAGDILSMDMTQRDRLGLSAVGIANHVLPEQISAMIAGKMHAISQETRKSTGLEENTVLTKDKADQAAAALTDNAKALVDSKKQIKDLQIQLGAQQAKNAALESWKEKTSAVKAAEADSDLESKVKEGKATPEEVQEMFDNQARQNAASERGPQAGLDAQNTVATARSLAANLRGQGGMSPAQHAEIVHVLAEIMGFLGNQAQDVQRQSGDLQDARRRLKTLESQYHSGRSLNR